MADPHVLYSTITRLAYNIAKQYYGGVHYVWCTPHFAPYSGGPDFTVADTSSPSKIYHGLLGEVLTGDRHSAKIKENREGLIRGAAAKRAAGVIDAQQEAEIGKIVQQAAIPDFLPLVLVIPFPPVKHLVQNVPVAERAHPLSVEYRIYNLPGAQFDVIELRRL